MTARTSDAKTDRVGNALTADETELLELYRRLESFCRRPGLPPCASRNSKKALAALHVAANDLDLVFEHLYDLGV